MELSRQISYKDFGNIFDRIGILGKEAEFFEDLCQYKNVRIERIVSRGQSSPEEGYYDQDWMEIVLVVQGEARLEIEGEVCTLALGEWRVLGPHVKHRVIETSRDPACVWLAIHIK